jgi:hypothetical protein
MPWSDSALASEGYSAPSAAPAPAPQPVVTTDANGEKTIDVVGGTRAATPTRTTPGWSADALASEGYNKPQQSSSPVASSVASPVAQAAASAPYSPQASASSPNNNAQLTPIGRGLTDLINNVQNPTPIANPVGRALAYGAAGAEMGGLERWSPVTAIAAPVARATLGAINTVMDKGIHNIGWGDIIQGAGEGIANPAYTVTNAIAHLAGSKLDPSTMTPADIAAALGGASLGATGSVAGLINKLPLTAITTGLGFGSQLAGNTIANNMPNYPQTAAAIRGLSASAFPIGMGIGLGALSNTIGAKYPGMSDVVKNFTGDVPTSSEAGVANQTEQALGGSKDFLAGGPAYTTPTAQAPTNAPDNIVKQAEWNQAQSQGKPGVPPAGPTATPEAILSGMLSNKVTSSPEALADANNEVFGNAQSVMNNAETAKTKAYTDVDTHLGDTPLPLDPVKSFNILSAGHAYGGGEVAPPIPTTPLAPSDVADKLYDIANNSTAQEPWVKQSMSYFMNNYFEPLIRSGSLTGSQNTAAQGVWNAINSSINMKGLPQERLAQWQGVKDLLKSSKLDALSPGGVAADPEMLNTYNNAEQLHGALANAQEVSPILGTKGFGNDAKAVTYKNTGLDQFSPSDPSKPNPLAYLENVSKAANNLDPTFIDNNQPTLQNIYDKSKQYANEVGKTGVDQNLLQQRTTITNQNQAALQNGAYRGATIAPDSLIDTTPTATHGFASAKPFVQQPVGDNPGGEFNSNAFVHSVMNDDLVNNPNHPTNALLAELNAKYPVGSPERDQMVQNVSGSLQNGIDNEFKQGATKGTDTGPDLVSILGKMATMHANLNGGGTGQILTPELAQTLTNGSELYPLVKNGDVTHDILNTKLQGYNPEAPNAATQAANIYSNLTTIGNNIKAQKAALGVQPQPSLINQAINLTSSGAYDRIKSVLSSAKNTKQAQANQLSYMGGQLGTPGGRAQLYQDLLNAQKVNAANQRYIKGGPISGAVTGGLGAGLALPSQPQQQ